MATETELSASMEDYLEAIYDLEVEEDVIRVKGIAERLGVAMPSASGALKHLQEKGLVRHEKYGYVELTPQGRQIGREMRQRHSALVAFLCDILNLDPDLAESEACKLEHAVGAETLDRLLHLLEFIALCPRGGHDWLAHLQGRWTEVACDHDCAECISQIAVPCAAPFADAGEVAAPQPLNQFGPGFRGTVARVCGQGPTRHRIMEMGVTPGADIEIRRIAPLGDPIEVIVRDYHLSLRKQEAAHILVHPHAETPRIGRQRRRRGVRAAAEPDAS